MRIEKIVGGLRVLAPAKINLYLEILGLRADGYHEIDTIMQAVSLFDELEFRPRASGDIRLEVFDEHGAPVTHLGPPEANLVVRAARLLAVRRSGEGGMEVSVDVRLTKRIPAGAGLGGGSSDAAATLVALAHLWDLRLSREELTALAAQLGSDVAFFLRGGLARSTGRGEVIDSLGDLLVSESIDYVLYGPGIHVSTSLIYRELDRIERYPVGLTAPSRIATMSRRSIRDAFLGGDLFFNRLQSVAFQAFEPLRDRFQEFQRQGFFAALMSGSGSTLYGICLNRGAAEEAARRVRAQLVDRAGATGSCVVVQGEPEFSLPGWAS